MDSMVTLVYVRLMAVAPKRVQLQFDDLDQNLSPVSMTSSPWTEHASHNDSCEITCIGAMSSKPKYPI